MGARPIELAATMRPPGFTASLQTHFSTVVASSVEVTIYPRKLIQ